MSFSFSLLHLVWARKKVFFQFRREKATIFYLGGKIATIFNLGGKIATIFNLGGKKAYREKSETGKNALHPL